MDEAAFLSPREQENVQRWWHEAIDLERKTGMPGMRKGYILDLVLRGLVRLNDPEFKALLDRCKELGY